MKKLCLINRNQKKNKPKTKKTMSATETPPNPPVKVRKSLEENVISLRCELRVLYESLKNKNEQLLVLEKELFDREARIKLFEEQFKKLADNPALGGEIVKKFSEIKVNHNMEEVHIKHQKEIAERDLIIKELNQKIMRLSENVTAIQRESNKKNERISELQNQIDRFRHVVCIDRHEKVLFCSN